MNVRKRFLHQAKDGRFGLLRQTLEILGEIQNNLDLAALRAIREVKRPRCESLAPTVTFELKSRIEVKG